MKGTNTDRKARETDSAAHKTIDALTFEMALVFFRLTEAARALLGQGKHSSGRRSVLKSLGRDGPQTVPQMAKMRSVSRQHVQKLVNGLLSDGLVRMRVNPHHKRSKIVALTARGQRFLDEMKRRERKYMEYLTRGIPHRDLTIGLRVVRALRQKLDSEEWKRLLHQAGE